MPAPHFRIAVVALHTSPYGTPGSGDVGGMNVLIRATAERMAARGHHVDVITRRYSRSLPRTEALSSGVTLRFIDAGPAELRPKAEHELFVDQFRHGMDSLGDFDVVHSHHWLAGMAALPFARDRGVPHVQSFHSIAAHASTALEEGERPESPGRMAGETWLAQNSDAIVAVSRAEERTVLERLGAEPQRVHVVLPGVDADLFHPLAHTLSDSRALPFAAEAEAAEPRRYVVAGARIEPLKGLDLAIRTIAALEPALRPGLVIAGGPTGGFEWYLDELHALARTLGVANRVRFVGPLSREALAGLLSRASAVLIPSHSETYGLVALEAAASGVPVVAAATGGLREAVGEHTGVLLDSRDPQVWARSLSSLLADDESARWLSAAARRFALTRSWSRTADETLAVYGSLLARSPAACGQGACA